ncbi:hypothetical protein ACFWXO_05070 [Kitasatospora sp. NPDC059088]|uniref:hypothetical protein n=1 Tax=Kitasatospora sp. NPDC059088 TaxID=3346722 RepID=UPI00368B86A8
MRDFRELRESLAAAGIMTSISQIAAAERDVRGWAAGRLSAVELCQHWGWETTALRPHYRRVGEQLFVMMLADEHTELVRTARARTDAGDPGPVSMWMRHRGQDEPVLVALPVVTVHRNNRHPVQQLLTPKRRTAADLPHLVGAEVPVNLPHRADRGIPCTLCGVYDAHYLRRDQRAVPGFVCEDHKDHALDQQMWPMHVEEQITEKLGI